MCGIVGIFNTNQKPVDREIISSMTNALGHRGPDGEGQFVKGAIGFGHRRLAILDVSNNGKQPMWSYNKRWVIIFNGCIYNYHSLKLQLEKLGHRFTSSCDTEVITEGLAQWGVEVFKKFNGMFAIAAYDTKDNTLYLSRDRFGVKPLYYFSDGNKIVFASEIKAILRHPDYKMDIDYAALNEYFTFQNVFGYNTLFAGITMLPPANTVKVSPRVPLKHYSWWDYDFSKPDNGMEQEEATMKTRKLMAQAVKRQMLADVPVGSYLSGGLDSGTITALASQQVPRLATFTAGFEMANVSGRESTFDERALAELVANYYKTEHYEQIIHASDLAWSLPRVVWHLEDLRLGMSYPNYYIARLASKFVKVCLQGTGGDELFGGYPWRYYHVFRSLDQQSFFDNYYHFWQRLVQDHDKVNLFQRQTFSAIDISAPKQTFERVFTFNNALSYDTPEDHIQNSLYFEIKTFLSGLLLVGDKLSMAHGLEERFPFLDNDLVNFAQKVPVKYKLHNLEKMKRLDENSYNKARLSLQSYDDGKNVLRSAMASILPPQIIKGKKQGFSSPDESWFRGENAQMVDELLLSKKSAIRSFIKPQFVRQIIDQHQSGKYNHRLLLWSFMNFEWWCRIFLEGQSIS